MLKGELAFLIEMGASRARARLVYIDWLSPLVDAVECLSDIIDSTQRTRFVVMSICISVFILHFH